jgi:hypothetical protein
MERLADPILQGRAKGTVMKFELLALDHDGTIARDGVLDPDVKASSAGGGQRSRLLVNVAPLPLHNRTIPGEVD